MPCCRDHSGYAPSQWGTALHCNAVSHWLGAYTEWECTCPQSKITYWHCPSGTAVGEGQESEPEQDPVGWDCGNLRTPIHTYNTRTDPLHTRTRSQRGWVCPYCSWYHRLWSYQSGRAEPSRVISIKRSTQFRIWFHCKDDPHFCTIGIAWLKSCMCHLGTHDGNLYAFFVFMCPSRILDIIGWHTNKQGKSEGFDSCDRPSNVTQIGVNGSIFQPMWSWNLMEDPEKQ